MRGKRFLSAVLVAVMLVAMMPATLAAEYSDTANHWAENQIAKWSDYGVLKGSDGKFQPDANITRGEMAIILDRLMAYQTKATNSFADLNNTWYTDAMLKANAAGIIKGSDGTIRPSDSITRQEAAVVLVRALGIAEATGETSFADNASIAAWAKGAIKAATSQGIFAGVGENRFAPTDNITRASVIKMLDNAIKGFYNKEGEYSASVTGTVIINTPNVTLKNMTITGNLIIAEGVGEGDANLNGVTVTGDTIVRGGGSNSIKVVGGRLNNIRIEKIAGDVRIVGSNSAALGTVLVSAGAKEVVIEGTVNKVVVAAGAPVKLSNTTIQELVVEASNADIVVDKSAVVNKATVTGANNTLSGEGKVTKATISGNGTAFDITGTTITVDKNATGTTVKDKAVAGGTTGTTTSTGEVKPVVPSTGGDSGSSYTSSDVIAANLHDTRADGVDGVDAKEGTFVKDDDIAQNYSVTGIVTGTNKNKITIRANHLMAHQAGGAPIAYWVGVGVPQVEGAAFETGFGEYNKDNTTFADVKDSEMDKNGKKYDTFYFDAANAKKTAYIAVKTTKDGKDNIVVYDIDMSKITLAPNVENVKTFVVHDKTTYNQLPADYVNDYPWVEGETTAESIGLPWLAVVYDSNVTGKYEFNITKNNVDITSQATSGTTSGTESTINKERYMMWHIGTPLADKDGLNQTDIYGTYAITVTKGGVIEGTTVVPEQSVTATADTFFDKNATNYTIKFMNGAETIQTLVLKEGTTIVPPPLAEKAGYELGWYTSETGGDELEANAVAGANVTYYARWTAIDLIDEINPAFTKSTKEDSDPYQLYQFNYNRLVGGVEIKLEVKDGENVVHRYTYTPEALNATAHVQWSLRDMGVKGTADSLTGAEGTLIERSNETILPAGTKFTYTITATLGENVDTITGEDTVTADMVQDVTYTPDVTVDLGNGVTGAMSKTSDTAYTLTLTGTAVTSGVPKSAEGEELYNLFFSDIEGDPRKGQDGLNALLEKLNQSITKYTAIAFDFTKFAEFYGASLVKNEAKYAIIQSNSPYLEVYDDDKILEDSATNTDKIYKSDSKWCKRLNKDFENGASGTNLNNMVGLAMLIADGETPVITFQNKDDNAELITITVVNEIDFADITA